MLQRPNFNFCKPLINNSEGCPFNQVSAAAMISASDEKWRPFNCFFSRVGLRTYQHLCIIMYKDVVVTLSVVSGSHFPVRLQKATKISTWKS